MEKNNCSFLCKRKLQDEQIIVETGFAPVGLKKVLWVDAYVQIDNIEPLNREVSYSGKVVFDVVFLDEANNIQTESLTSPFLNKIINENISANSKVIINIGGVNAEYVAESDKIQAVITICSYVLCNENLEILSNSESDLCVKTEAVISQNLIKAECIEITENLTYPITDRMENIISIKPKICLKTVEVDTDVFEVQGEILTNIKYLSNSDDVQKILTVNYVQPFKREIEVQGLKQGDYVDVNLAIKYDKFKYELDKTEMRALLEVPISFCYAAYSQKAIPCVIDAFSVKNKVNLITQSHTKTEISEIFYNEEKIEGSAVLNDNLPRIDKIIGFSDVSLTITNSNIENNTLTVEGLIRFNLAYLNDETNNINSVNKEIPFSVRFNIDLTDFTDLFITATLSEAEIIAKRGREIFVDGKIKIGYAFSKLVTEAMITDVENSEVYPEKTAAIEIYFGKAGDDLWDIAKELHVNPEIITIQNPDIILPLEQHENIVIYHQKNN